MAQRQLACELHMDDIHGCGEPTAVDEHLEELDELLGNQSVEVPEPQFFSAFIAKLVHCTQMSTFVLLVC